MTNPIQHHPPAPPAGLAVVVGASGGIGGALVDALRKGGAFHAVVALSRGALSRGALSHGALSHGALSRGALSHGALSRGETGPDPAGPTALLRATVDLLDEQSIATAAQGAVAEAAARFGPPRLVLVASGLLQGEGIAPPERSLRALDAASLLQAYRVNAVGPALVAKHMLPLLPREGRSVFAALSARVGSIGDNRLGGWYAYRASKAALNMILRNLAIELARTHPEALCLGLHPGTVDTALSRPFQGGVPKEKLFLPGFAAERLLAVIAAAERGQSGQVLAWNGTPVPP